MTPPIPKACKFCQGPIVLDYFLNMVSCITIGCQAMYMWGNIQGELGPKSDEAEPGLKIPDPEYVIRAMVESYSGSMQDMLKKLESKFDLVIRRLP